MAKTKLTSRQRVLCALNHQEPDRVPFNLALTTDIYARLREHLGLPAEPEKHMGIWTDVSPSLDLLDSMQVDVFYAGMGGPETIKFGTPQEVMDEVRRYILAMGPKGGYIVSPAHNVQSDVPARNLTAIPDAIAEYGVYPLR